MCDLRFAEAQYPAAKTSPHEGISFSSEVGGGSSKSSSSHRTPGPAGRRPRVLFDAFNLEAASDELCQDQSVGSYDAQKRPLKASRSSVAMCACIHAAFQGILRKHAVVAGKGSAGEGASASGTDSDALWTVGSRYVRCVDDSAWRYFERCVG
jgi:hypothetical protein